MNPAVLLVDDEASICSALRRTFKQSHYQIFEANSGEQALTVLDQNNIDVVISDQCMPGMSGTELLKIVKNRYPQVSRIILSGHSDANDLVAAINQANIDQFVSKPWNDQELLASVNNAISTLNLPQQAPPMDQTQKGIMPKKTIIPIQDSFLKKQIDLEDSIKQNLLTLEETLYWQPKADNILTNIHLSWPKLHRFGHQGIINIAKQSGYIYDLFRWYLIHTNKQLQKNQEEDKHLIIDLFSDAFVHNDVIKKQVAELMEKPYSLIFRIPFDILQKNPLTDFLTKIYTSNNRLLLKLDKRVININELENTPIRYIEMDGNQNTINNNLLTAKRIKMLKDAKNLSIKTILAGVNQKNQRDYAEKMEFDFF